MVPSLLAGVLQDMVWCFLTLIFLPNSFHSIMYHFRRSSFSSTSRSLLSVSLLTASLADPYFSSSSFLSVLSFIADVLCISAVTSVYLLLHWIFHSSQYILGKLVLFGVSPLCSGQYLFGLLRISDHSLYKNQMLGHISKATSQKLTLQKLPARRMSTQVWSVVVWIFWNLFLIAKLKSLQLQESTSPPPLVTFFAKLVIFFSYFLSAHLVFLICFPFFFRELQTGSLIWNIKFSFHISFFPRTNYVSLHSW